MRAGVQQTLQCRCMPNKIAVAASFIPGFFTDGVVVNSGDRTVDSAHLRLTYSSIDPTDVLQSALQPRIWPFSPHFNTIFGCSVAQGPARPYVCAEAYSIKQNLATKAGILRCLLYNSITNTCNLKYSLFP
jgi:hypothetical protein